MQQGWGAEANFVWKQVVGSKSGFKNNKRKIEDFQQVSVTGQRSLANNVIFH